MLEIVPDYFFSWRVVDRGRYSGGAPARQLQSPIRRGSSGVLESPEIVQRLPPRLPRVTGELARHLAG